MRGSVVVFFSPFFILKCIGCIQNSHVALRNTKRQIVRCSFFSLIEFNFRLQCELIESFVMSANFFELFQQKWVFMDFLIFCIRSLHLFIEWATTKPLYSELSRKWNTLEDEQQFNRIWICCCILGWFSPNFKTTYFYCWSSRISSSVIRMFN